MKILLISASPNRDGLTSACISAAEIGLRAAGVQVEEVRLNDLKVGMCHACDNGWGTCRQINECQVEDDFQAVHASAIHADGLILVTPVYWGEMSEAMKAFTDRLRRCEAIRKPESSLAGKPVMAIAAAGGSGNGMITCLLSLERWIDQLRARKFDLIPVNRWSRPYKLATIQAAAEAMVT